MKDGICDDCNELVSEKVGVDNDETLLCAKCGALRVERKEAIQEVVDTEISYGKDLKIIKEVVYLSFVDVYKQFSPIPSVFLTNTKWRRVCTPFFR